MNFQEDIVWYGDFQNNRKTTKEISNKFWNKIKRWRWIFSNIPFLSQVFVTNTLAYDNVDKNSDIDLFLVGKQGRLWTARAFLLFWFNLFGLRVRSKNRYAKFSPEFFVAEDKLELETLLINDDYYFNFWLADLVQIWPENDCYTIWKSNLWIKDNLPIAYRSPRGKGFEPCKPSFFRRLFERILIGEFGERIERRLMNVQKEIIGRTTKRIGVNPSVVVDPGVIKLHFNDRRELVRDFIKEKLNEFLAENK